MPVIGDLVLRLCVCGFCVPGNVSAFVLLLTLSNTSVRVFASALVRVFVSAFVYACVCVLGTMQA